MKSLFSTIKNNLCFNYAQRLAMVCLFVVITFSTAFADGSWNGYARAEAKFATSTSVKVGQGKVYVGKGSNPTPEYTSGENGSYATDTNKTSGVKNFTFTWFASVEPSTNSAFDGWYKEEDASGVKYKSDIKFSEDITVSNDGETAEGNPKTVTYYALFRKVIDAPTDVSFTKTTQEMNETFDVNLFSATNFQVKSYRHKDGESRKFEAKLEDGSLTSNKAKVSLFVGDDVIDGDVFVVTLSTDNGGDVEVNVKIISKISVTFNLPKRGQGYYEAIQTNNANVVTYNSQCGESKGIDLTDTKQFRQKLKAYPDEGYRLYRWIITDKNNNTTIQTSEDLEYTLNDGDKISVEFLPEGIAQFMVKGVPGVYYYELDAAIEAAKEATSKTVVVYSSGKLYTEYKDPIDGKYEFTIPSGVTLLVPGDDSHNMSVTLDKKYVVETSPGTSVNPFRTLTLPNGVHIIVNGNICVFATVTYYHGANGTPINPGIIHMEDGAKITINSGATLTAFGYITGNYDSETGNYGSEVIVNSGANVYELFQFRDWRGGSVSFKMEDVFPLSQYYIQNIETKMTINYGAALFGSSVVNVSLAGILPLTVQLVATTSNKNKGLFCISDGVQIIKWYDSDSDRQKYLVKGLKDDAMANIGIVYASLNSIYKLDSEKYILPFTNNLDVTLDNIDMKSEYDISLLPGANLTLQNKSTFTGLSNIYVHDAEFLTTVEGSGFCYVQNGGNAGAKDYEYMPVWYTPTKNHNTCLLRSRPLDATVDIQNGCSWIVNNSSDNDAGLYTTGETKSGNEYGANIQSTTGGGKVEFNKIVESTNKNLGYYQINPKEQYASIPVTNARLRNDDGTWSAGENATEGDEYIYSSSRKKWVTPSERMSFGADNYNTFLVSLPNVDTKTQEVEIGVITNENLNINDFSIEWPNNSYFKKGGDARYDDVDHKLIMPITYTLTKVHNKDVNPNTYTGNITVSCTYTTSNGEDVIETTDVVLSAIEDYTPEFTVTINDFPQLSGSEYDFGETKAQNPVERIMKINPKEGNVASLDNIQWEIEATGSFVATEEEVMYNPQEKTSGEYDEGELIIKATYKDKDNNSIFTSMTINLKGKATLQEPTLAFRDDLPIEIYQAENITDIFGDLGSRGNVDFTYTYSDGTPADGLLVATKEENGNYTLTAETTDYVDNRVVVVTATQEASNVMSGASRSITITIKPVVAWNWSTLYFGTERDNPVTVAREGDWSLTKLSGDDKLVTLSGTSPNYSATINAGTDAEQVYTATFKFVQGGYEKVFTSNIYADPRILDLCVEYEREFKDVSTQNVTTVTFDESTKNITFRPQDKWEINMIGTPDKLTFTASGDGQWYIGERANASINYSDVVAWSNVSGTQTIQLKPTTNQVIIQYGASDNNGKIANLCISELSLSADKDVVYFPINKDDSDASKKIVLTHASADKPSVTIDSKFTTIVSEPQPVGSKEDPYYQTTVTIKGSKSTVEKGEYTLVVTQEGDEIQIPIYVDEFPQGLPIKLKDDDAKRYHFIAVETDKVVWDGENKKVVFQMPEGAQKTRSVTFAFEGAPSRVSFTSSQDIVDNQWRIEESVDGTPDSYVPSGLANRDTESGSNFVHNLQYTTRYLRIVYTSDNTSEVALSNFVIEGDPMLLVNPDELEFSNEDKTKTLTLTAINLRNIKVELNNTTDFKMSHGSEESASLYELTPDAYPNALGENKVGEIEINTEWITNSMVNDGIITIYNMDDNNSVLAKVKLVGAGKYLKLENAEKTGLYTGIPDGTRDVDGDGEVDDQYKYTYHGSQYSNYTYHEVDLRNAFSVDGTALFDYLFVYGETTPSEGDNITAPAGDKGSNARTPCYVYIRDMDVNGNFDRYRFVTMLDNVNVGDKATVPNIIKSSSETSENGNGETLAAVDVKYIEVSNELPNGLSVYITGFAPYATTGYTKADEGVFFFRGNSGAKLHVYLENAHIFARNKMKDGQPFYTRGDERNPTFTEKYARGSGGVLVFECVDKSENLLTMAPFEVTIHTIGRNLLKSNYGCFNYFFGMDPFQISAPIHVRLHSADHERTSKTVLNFTDEWPTKLGVNRVIETSKRTNGFLSLQKQSNNAPSIDLGNPHTVVNFLGGQVELQNAQIVSTNYKTTLAISYRSGEYGSDDLGLKFASGIGTDAVDGTVNFHDGTITILPMWVKEEYKNYYLIDKDAEGNEIKRDTGRKDEYEQPIYEYQTTCLRTPKNTNVYGGSICWLRACQHVTSKGGAPSDGTGKLLGQYVYEFGGDDTKDSETGLVTSIKFPASVEGLENYYETYHSKDTYGIESVMPDKDNKLYFWIPEGYGGVTPEKDNILTTWKTCMTEISAGFQGQKGSVGGNTSIESNEEVKYLLYCKIDDNIHGVISKGEGQGDDKIYEYKAPVKVPDVALGFFEGKQYTTISPTFVGGSKEHEVLSDIPYKVTDKVYYVTTATADVWQTFTAPFNVARIWVVETFDENKLVKDGERTRTRSEILTEQAKHNADFAAFFAVAMAIGTTDSFEKIYESYLNWAKIEDEEKDNINYTKRGKYPLTPYVVDILEDGKTSGNWEDANFYINHNEGNWGLTDNIEQFEVQWKTLTSGDLEDGILMHQGQTYSLLFPYCVGCWDYNDDKTLKEREMWDYWSGKFLIFESADAPQTINGSDFLIGDDDPTTIDVFNSEPSEGEVVVTGNSTLSFLNTNKKDIYNYVPDADNELFSPNTYGDDLTILPTTAFLYGEVPTNVEGSSVLSISRMGQIKYRPSSGNNDDDTQTGGEHVPTINGGSDLFVTSVAEGINIAVGEPQYVGVFSATGQLIYSGWVETSVDVELVVDGVYVVVGENTSLKVLY